MTNLAIITSPGHYFNILESTEQLRIDKKQTVLILFSFNFDTRTNQFFDEIEAKNEWQTTHRVSLWNLHNPKLSLPYNIFTMLRYAFWCIPFVGRQFDTVLVNQIDTNYQRLILNIVRFRQVVSLDEGNAIMKLIEKRYDKAHNAQYWLKMPQKIVFFTSYDIAVHAPDARIMCENAYSKRLLSAKTVDKNQVMIIGSPYVEDGILAEKQYHQQYLRAIRNRHPEQQIIYISHRRETPENLEKIRILGIQPLSLNAPIELYLLEQNYTPAVVTGFYSAAILNIKKILENPAIAFEAHRLNITDVQRVEYAVLARIYAQFAEAGIIVIGN